MSDYVFIESVGGDCGGLVLLLHMLYVCVCEYAEVGRNLWVGGGPTALVGVGTCNTNTKIHNITNIRRRATDTEVRSATCTSLEYGVFF